VLRHHTASRGDGTSGKLVAQIDDALLGDVNGPRRLDRGVVRRQTLFIDLRGAVVPSFPNLEVVVPSGEKTAGDFDEGCFLITSRSNSGSGDKKVKTSTSERFVPIHPHLTEIGFMDFVEERRRSGSAKLFPELPRSTTGYYSDPFSKWFRRFLEKSKATRPKTCFHSFRHSFRDALREARIDHDIALALGGWSSGGGKESVETAEAYGQGFRVSTLSEAIKQIEYPNLDLSHLVESARKPADGL
jgi:hypothetical protein